MNKIVSATADLITSLGMIIFVLLMTVMAMIFVGHGLYHQVFLKCMTPWQAEAASWVLSFGVETTVLVITCNVKHLSSNKLPLFFAICSGFIVLFFIDAFDFTQSGLDIAIRWFIGLLVSGVNYVYSELFVKKLSDAKQSADLRFEIANLNQQNNSISQELINTKSSLTKANLDIERLVEYVAELETFKKDQLDKLKCPYCQTAFETVFKLSSHKGVCEHNPKKGQKQSIFEEHLR
ncbi:MAG TPA: hypothetical protein PK325_01380 [Cyclobacteriaceae bacterium]|nr:hypothetical protein [Cyclobacteriaceae bacterium]HMV08079.1 hypothetical protein [Cyclobacteriaceae bacterium]HMV88295.1 hypothetical protein [Cyclobacteriaceae bacterium]HMX00720.1 hypothetical protein [Cyclobacteriaceae bacterium]HMX49405.1 hypothetical protein [Cyclobacteriaceae bacterium]